MDHKRAGDFGTCTATTKYMYGVSGKKRMTNVFCPTVDSFLYFPAVEPWLTLVVTSCAAFSRCRHPHFFLATSRSSSSMSHRLGGRRVGNLRAAGHDP
jgi:hypothetical protein